MKLYSTIVVLVVLFIRNYFCSILIFEMGLSNLFFDWLNKDCFILLLFFFLLFELRNKNKKENTFENYWESCSENYNQPHTCNFIRWENKQFTHQRASRIFIHSFRKKTLKEIFANHSLPSSKHLYFKNKKIWRKLNTFFYYSPDFCYMFIVIIYLHFTTNWFRHK